MLLVQVLVQKCWVLEGGGRDAEGAGVRGLSFMGFFMDVQKLLGSVPFPTGGALGVILSVSENKID